MSHKRKRPAAYDIAMVKAEGDHTVATEKCQTLQASMMQACKDQADAAYDRRRQRQGDAHGAPAIAGRPSLGRRRDSRAPNA